MSKIGTTIFIGLLPCPILLIKRLEGPKRVESVSKGEVFETVKGDRSKNKKSDRI